MSKFSEQTLDNWCKPASDTEEQRISNAISMIRDAIKSSDDLKDKNIEIFVQGSYANNTNVRIDSDVDVCIMLKDTFYSEYPDGATDDDYGFIEGSNNYSTYRIQVIESLTDKFGQDSIIVGNKSIKIKSNTYHVKADAVPSFQYRNYNYLNSTNPNVFVEGVKFFSKLGQEVINYPKLHIENGKSKNNNTQRRFKRLIRIFKRIRYKMADDGQPVNSSISSFLLECLLWNVPNSIYNDYYTWTDRIKQSIIFLYENTKEEKYCKEWGEVSEMFYLFHSGRKWDVNTVNNYLIQLWNYLEFE